MDVIKSAYRVASVVENIGHKCDKYKKKKQSERISQYTAGIVVSKNVDETET